MFLFPGLSQDCELGERARRPDIPKKNQFLFRKDFFFIPKKCLFPELKGNHDRGLTFGGFTSRLKQLGRLAQATDIPKKFLFLRRIAMQAV